MALLLTAVVLLGLFGLLCIARGIRRLCQGHFLQSFAWGFVGIVLLGPIVAGAFLPAVAVNHAPSTHARCMSNLSQIGKACVMYSMDHDEALPASFLLLTNYVSNPKIFVCPHAKKAPGPIDTVDDWTDYVLVTNLTAGSDSVLALAYCKPENHADRDGVNVLYVDGSVGWTTTDHFDQIPCDILNHSRVSKKPQHQPGG